MPVFLRWLLVDIIVMRILRHRRVRPHLERAYPIVSRYTTRFGRRVYPAVGGYEYARRRRRFSCCSGCLLMLAMTVIAGVGVIALLQWTL